MKYFLSTIILACVLFFSGTIRTSNLIEKEMLVTEVLETLRDKNLFEVDEDVSKVSAAIGEDIVKYGILKNAKGPRVAQQSKHFVCTSCHNVEREDPDLTKADPEARLDYVVGKGLPYLQGSPLYGAINRTAFYNGDYEKKYGELVTPARNDLREAIQLCAVECSQGRKLKKWELESVLAYLWTIGLKMEDLDLTDEEYKQIDKAAEGMSSNREAIELVKSKFLNHSPATFVEPPSNRKEGNGLVGNRENGEKLYKASCLHCHGEGRYSFYQLDDSKLSLKQLKNHMGQYTRKSIYQVTRWGTPVLFGKKAYMPQYTLEKMSEQQLADLRAYIEGSK